jgi:uncharacterized repeat protein (TIGR01451 family)
MTAAGRSKRRNGRHWWAALLVASAVLLALPAVASAAQITGTAFEDFNDNGSRNTAPMVDAGVGGITVTAYRADGSPVGSATTAADGSYTLNVPDGIGEVRVEFTGLPAGYQPARHGAASGTTVQFVNGSASGVDVGVLQPANYCQDNPQLAICFMNRGPHTGPDATNAANPSIRLVPDGTPEGTVAPSPGTGPVPGEPPGGAALFSQTGAVFGVAQPTGSDFLYSSAYTKRGADYGPGGPGAIYRTDIDQANAGTPNASVFFDVNDLPGDPAGTPARGTGGWNWPDGDDDAVSAVGNSGLGNLASNIDGSELYTVGLATRELIRVPIPADGSSPSPASANTYPIPNPCTPASDARPAGVGWHDGLLYVGGVCSMASVGDPVPQPGTALSVHVYTFDPTTGTFSTDPVLETPLDPDRLCAIRGNAGGGPAEPYPSEICPLQSADWHPWTSDITQGFYAQPMLTDIEFDGDDLILGIRDRYPDQRASVQTGYNLRACLTAAGYELESNASCGGVTNPPGQVTNYGPGDGLFYYSQQWQQPGGNGHDYLGLGSALSIPGYPELRMTATDAGAYPIPSSSAGVLYMNNSDGSYAKGYNIYRVDPANPDLSFGKSNSLGDLEALCESAPIEIGNYVWLDPDRDGIQDAGETKLGNVTVELLDGSGNVIATTTTDANGQYYFNESNVPGAVQPNTAYTVRIPLDQAPLAPYLPTGADASEQLRDSDGITEGRYVVDRLTTGAAGHNDHTHDFGFHARTSNYTFTKTSSRQRVRVGDQLTYTLTAQNTGPDASLAGGVVRDPVPERFDVVRVTAGAGATCNVDDRDVRCTLAAMAVGQKIDVQIRVRAIRAGGTVNEAFLDPPPGSCCAPPPPEVPVRIVKPQLGLTKGVNKKTLVAGEKVTYTIRTRNPSNATLRNVRTCDNLPPGLVFVSAKPKAKLSKGQYCWTAKRLGAGKRKTYKLTARALQGIKPGKKVNRATAKSPDAKTKRAKRTVRVRAGGGVLGGGLTG